MPKWKAIVFDLDDTLYPECEYVLGGFRVVADWVSRHHALPAETGFASLRALHESGVRGDTFNRWLDAHGLPLSLVPDLVTVYRLHQPTLAPFPGIRELISSLSEDIPLGLVSDGYLAVQHRKWNALPFETSFRAVVFSDEWGRANWKPSSVPFEAVAQGLNMAPGSLVYVADNPGKDFIGARRLGMATIWARYSQGDYATQTPPSPAHAADMVANSVDELKALLLQ